MLTNSRGRDALPDVSTSFRDPETAYRTALVLKAV
jgi:hypothetical protein